MITARLKKSFAAGPDSRAFTLDVQLEAGESGPAAPARRLRLTVSPDLSGPTRGGFCSTTGFSSTGRCRYFCRRRLANAAMCFKTMRCFPI